MSQIGAPSVLNSPNFSWPFNRSALSASSPLTPVEGVLAGVCVSYVWLQRGVRAVASGSTRCIRGLGGYAQRGDARAWWVLLCIGTVHMIRVVDLEEGVCERSERAVARVHRRDEADMHVVQVVEGVLVVEADLAVSVLVEPLEVVRRLWSRRCARSVLRLGSELGPKFGFGFGLRSGFGFGVRVRVRVRARVRARDRGEVMDTGWT